jgi:hypothetical protein
MTHAVQFMNSLPLARVRAPKKRTTAVHSPTVRTEHIEE